MPQADVTNQKLQVQFTFYPWLQNGGATDNSQYKSQTMSLAQMEAEDPNLKTQLGALDPLLADTLGDEFNTAWQNAKASTIQSAIQSIEAQAKQAGTPISNPVLTAPDEGPVTATVDTVQTGNESVPWLSLAYQLNGWKLTFDAVTAGANWLDTFDVTLTLATPVPELPFGFAPTQSIMGSNAQFGPNNAAASFDAGADNFFTGVWNQISGGMYKSDYDYTKQAILNETDAPQSFSIKNPLADALTQLNKEGPQVVAAGFTQFAVSIDNGNQLTATLTHPLDPGPVLQDATNPPGGIELNVAALAASNSVVPPGGTLHVTGTRFPLPSSTQLYLQWPNSATGTTQSDLSSELMVTPKGGSPQFQNVSPATGPVPPGIVYTYTATGLTPGVEYSFVARCRDTAAWSLWSQQPLTLTTGSSDTVQLMLRAGSAFQPVQVGTATLAASSGDWSSQVVIPTTTPPGSYVLAAELGGETLATLNLTVGAVTAHLDIIDPATNQVISDPVVLNGASFTVRGEAFPNNAKVALTINGQQVAQPTAINGQFIQTLTSPANLAGNLTVTASGGGDTASTMYQQLGVIG
ncbi:MAG TPA: hypothetical protein VMU34_10730 [Mycobacterium sp.]|nr:hypothetical protein [Mycobacterium sp.]